jgi:hypothetical protein
MQDWWGVVASPALSVAAGVLGLLLLVGARKHRENGRVSRRKISASVMLAVTFYTMLVLIFGHWGMKIPLSETVHNNFGDERVAWLLVFLIGDVFGRYYELFD